VKANQATHWVGVMCRLLQISRSGFYAWRDRPMSDRQRSDLALMARIEAIHRRSKGVYGSPNIRAELADDHGIRVGRKRVARLMRSAGLRGATLRRYVVTTTSDSGTRPAVDLVDRQFYADGPDRLWVADITFIPTWTGFLYLAMVLDVYSRRVVGWAMETHLRTELILSALNMAITQRRPEAVIHHSDRGCPIHQLCIRQAVPRGRCHALDGIGRGCVRQRHGRELFRLPRARAAQSASVQKSGGGEDGCF
jgi:transposase InsO family protein